MIACARCGTGLPEDARFCPSCGLAIQSAQPREERRIVTVLFADLVEFTRFSEAHDHETVKRIIDRAFEGLAEIVTVYGGRVDKILGDEIMAVFGAPQSHEDDPERAVRSAIEMQRSLARYSADLLAEQGLEMSMRVGINTGEVMAGVIGGGDAYTVVGDAVNVASRLVKAARPGAILVGPSTYAATQGAVEYLQIEPLDVKGKAEAIAAAEVVRERAVTSGPSTRVTAPLVGRDPELAVLEGIAAIVARDRRPAAVTILGDAGMGKSRLVAEFASRQHDARVLWGRSLHYGTSSPSFAVEEMVRAAFGVLAADDPVQARKRIGDGVAALGIGSEADRMYALAGVREAPSGAVRRSSGGAAGPAAGSSPRGGDMNAALTLFETLASKERLLMLVFQELHWAEAALMEMVGELMSRVRDVPLLVVALGRAELAEQMDDWSSRAGNTMLTLQPLPRDAAAALLDALAQSSTLHSSVRENVLERAGGNPFFIEEFVRLALDRTEGTTAVPVGVQALVAARLDTLDEVIRRVAQDAAVIGENFWPDALSAMDPEAKVADSLNALIAKELIEPVPQPSIPGREEMRFRQTVVREVAYNSLPKQVRSQRHAAVAAWLEDVTCACELEREFADLVAHHYERAATSARDVGASAAAHEGKAREYLERAGDEAMSKDAAAAAASFYERALQFSKGDADDLHLRVHLGEAFVGSWNPTKAQTHLELALDDARRLGERRAEGKALRLLGDLERIRGNGDVARSHIQSALLIAKETGDALEEAEGLRSHGLLDMVSGRVAASPLWFRQSLARYRDLGDKRGEGWSLQNLGWADLLLGRLDEAMEMLEEGVQVFGEIGDTEGIGWCLGLRSWTLLFQGKLDEADDLARSLMEMAGGLEMTPGGMGGMGLEVERVLRAIVACNRLHFDEAIKLATMTFIGFEEVESAWGQAMARYPIAMAQIARCEIGPARETLHEATQHALESGDPLAQGLIGFAFAYCELEAGDVDRARALGEQALARTSEAGVEWHSTISKHWIRGELLRREGKLEEACVELGATIESSGGLVSATRPIAVLADVLREMGQTERAIQMARRAIAESGDFMVERIWARRALAGALADAGDLVAALAEVDQTLLLLGDGEWEAERVRALALKARVLDEAGRHDEAAEAHQAARRMLDAFGSDADTHALSALLSH